MVTGTAGVVVGVEVSVGVMVGVGVGVTGTYGEKSTFTGHSQVDVFTLYTVNPVTISLGCNTGDKLNRC